MAEPLIDVDEMAKRLAMSPKWVRDHAAGRRRPQIPCIRLGDRALRFRWSDVETWLDRLGKGNAHAA